MALLQQAKALQGHPADIRTRAIRSAHREVRALLAHRIGKGAPKDKVLTVTLGMRRIGTDEETSSSIMTMKIERNTAAA